MPQTRRIHPAWIAALVTFFTLVATAGFRSAPSVLIVPLEEAFGWGRDQISLAISVNVLLYGLTAPFAAALMERFTVRKVVMGALTTVSTGAFRFEAIQNSLGIARNILTDRLNTLVAGGVLEKRMYTEKPQRYEYHLTAKGKELIPILQDLERWGKRHN